MNYSVVLVGIRREPLVFLLVLSLLFLDANNVVVRLGRITGTFSGGVGGGDGVLTCSIVGCLRGAQGGFHEKCASAKLSIQVLAMFKGRRMSPLRRDKTDGN